MATGARVYFMKDLYGTAMTGTVKSIGRSTHCMDNGRIIVTVNLDNGRTVTDYIELFTIV